jgi:heme/copper-type cytochrome/quinol oxidase subunit 2
MSSMMSGSNMGGGMMGGGSMMNGSTMSGSMMSGSMMNGSTMSGSMMGPGETGSTIPGAREIAVTASSFTYAPNEIHVRTGEGVTIVLAASDTLHTFTVDELSFSVSATPGRIGRASFHAPESPGRYTVYCAVAGHRAAGMTATLVVDAA